MRAVIKGTWRRIAKAECYVREGELVLGARVRVLRDGVQVYEGPVASLYRYRDVSAVQELYTCAVGLVGWDGFQQDDVLESA